MSTSIPFAEVREPLERLLADPNLAPLHGVLARLRDISNTSEYPSDIYKILVEMLTAMSRDVASGARSQDDLRDPKVLEGYSSFTQEAWQVDTVNQAQNIFQFFHGRYSQPADDSLWVPIVLLAMTRSQADDLADGAANSAAKERHPNLDELLAVIDRIDTSTPWQANYGDRPEDWRPFQPRKAESFTQILAGAFERLRTAKVVRPRFIHPEELLVGSATTEKERREHRDRLRSLREGGCLVVIDSISLYHPQIQHAFHSCKLDAFSSASVVRVAPFREILDLEVQLAFLFEQRIDHEYLFRRDLEYDELCAEAPNPINLARFLKLGTERWLGDSASNNQKHWFKAGGSSA